MIGMADGVGQKLRERGFVAYFAAMLVGLFSLLSLNDLAFKLVFSDRAFDLSSYATWDLPINLGLSAIVAIIYWFARGKPLFRINKPDITKLDLDNK